MKKFKSYKIILKLCNIHGDYDVHLCQVKAYKPNKMKTIIITLLLLSIPGLYGSRGQEKVFALKDTLGWKKIGIATINLKTANDEIYVLESDRYSSVKFFTSEVPIDIVDLEVFYETGDKQDIKVNISLNAPGESQVIELTGGERRLTKIAFEYKQPEVKNGRKAVVELWGLKVRQSP